jgi:crotonobetainyl-CoA:carnitine CoA-transferase CaiB-like acyl-CoA transferase
LMEQPQLIDDARFKGNQARVRHVDELDAIIAAWSKRFTAENADDILSNADIPCTLVYTAAECAADPQFRHRGMVREVDDPLFGSVLHAGVVPHVPEDPGRVRWPGPAVGAHTDEVMTELLGMRPQEIAALRTEGVL